MDNLGHQDPWEQEERRVALDLKEGQANLDHKDLKGDKVNKEPEENPVYQDLMDAQDRKDH